MEIRLDTQRLDEVAQSLGQSVTDLPSTASAMRSAADGAAGSGAHYGSRLDDALRLFGDRWSREMDFVSQDLQAASSNLRRAGDALLSIDQRIESEIRAAT